MVNLDPETKHYKVSVYHLLEGVGTIGGLFELLFGGILTLYLPIRKHLYFFSFLSQFYKFKKYGYVNQTGREIDTIYSRSMHSNMVRRDAQNQRVDEDNKLLYNHDEAKAKEESKRHARVQHKFNMKYLSF